MTDIVDTHEEGRALDRVPLIIRRPLEKFLDEAGVAPGGGTVEAEEIGEGHSNITYAITRGGEKFVLRRPPRPPLPPSAHDVLREAKLLKSLEGRGVRVPTVLAICEDESVLGGVPFYVMAFEEGVVMASSIAPVLDDPEQRRRVCEELVDALVEMHAVDWQAAGLEGFGKPTGYLDRQLRRFGGLWEHNRTRELPVLDRLTAWLAEHKPESGEATIVHGDYRLGNTMFAPGPPARLAAIFDWELATIGDPLADVGYLVATWSQADDPQDALRGLGAASRRPGFLTRDELIARYEERSGRSMSDVRWYMTLALWKSAVFLEGSYKRRLAGTTEDAYFDRLEAGVPAMAERAWAIATG
jgi:aminoglycoside phosphotransferase (APT) family kinase protein